MKILIADDDARMRAMLQKILNQGLSATIRVFECANGFEAITMAQQCSPDWILMDVRMPGLGGIPAARKILRARPDTRILIVTNYDESAYREAASDAGALAVVSKDNLQDVLRYLNPPPSGGRR